MSTEAAKDMQIRRRVFVGTLSNYAGQFITLAAWFFLTPFILHELGSVAYGLWVLVGSLVAYGSLLDFGIWGAVIKYVAEHRARGENDSAQALVATALSLYSALGLVAILLSVALAPLFPLLFNVPASERTTAVWLVVLMGSGIGIFIPCNTSLAVLRGLQRYDIVNLVGVIGTLFDVVATVTVLRLGGGLLGLVAVHVAGMLVIQIPAIWWIRRIAPELRFGWRGASRHLVRQVLSYSWPLFVMDTAGRFQTKSDEITIGAFMPIDAVTPYAVARKLSEVTHLLTKQFMKVLLPLSSELAAENDKARLRALYLTGTRLTLAIFLPIGGTLVVLAEPILTMWVGAQHATAPHVVAILTVAAFAATSQWPAAAVLQGMARHRWLAATSLSSGLANLLLSIWLVHPFGLTGVAVGTLIPTVVENFGLVLPYATRVLGIRAAEVLQEIFLPALLPAIPMGATVFLLERAFAPSSLPAIVGVAGSGCLVYGIGYLSMGASESERRSCRTAAHRTMRLAEAQIRRR